jgi:hypothetical protein
MSLARNESNAGHSGLVPTREAFHICACGRTFPETLKGAWDAKERSEQMGHCLISGPY